MSRCVFTSGLNELKNLYELKNEKVSVVDGHKQCQ